MKAGRIDDGAAALNAAFIAADARIEQWFRTFTETETPAPLTMEALEECMAKVQRPCKTPVPVDVVANPRHLAALRRTLSLATGKIGLISSVAGALPIYESVDMPDNALVVSMSDGTMQVIAISGGALTEEESAQALRAAAAVKADLASSSAHRS